MKRTMRSMGWLAAVGCMSSWAPVGAAMPGGAWQHGMADESGGKLSVFTASSRIGDATLWTAAATSSVEGSALVWMDRSGPAADGQSTVHLHRVAIHPGAGGGWGIARWEAPAAGSYVIEATFLHEQAGPGAAMDIQVLLRGRSCFDRATTGDLPEQKLRLTVDLSENEPVVFAVASSGDGGAADGVLLTVALGSFVAGSRSMVLPAAQPLAEPLAATNNCRVGFESFSAGMAGWGGTPPLSGGSVFWNGAAIQADFLPLPLPIPENVRIVASRAASEGRFVGDWATSGIDQVSFDFHAEGSLPSWVQMRIHDGTRYAFKGFAVTELNAWQHFTASVEDMATGGWNGSLTEADFAVLRTNVQEVSLLIMRCGVVAQSFKVDNFAIDRVQRALHLGYDSAAPAITWAHLLSNRTYRIETVRNPGDTNWIEVASVTATDRVSSIAIPLTNAFGIVRLVRD